MQALAKNPLRVIDRKDDRVDLLTEINLKNIKWDRTEITRVKNLAILNHDRLYERYLEKNEDGSPYEVIRLNFKDGAASFNIVYGAKVKVLIKNEEVSEEDAMKIQGQALKKYYTGIAYDKTHKIFKEKYAHYLNKYDVIVLVDCLEWVKHDHTF